MKKEYSRGCLGAGSLRLYRKILTILCVTAYTSFLFSLEMTRFKGFYNCIKVLHIIISVISWHKTHFQRKSWSRL